MPHSSASTAGGGLYLSSSSSWWRDRFMVATSNIAKTAISAEVTDTRINCDEVMVFRIGQEPGEC